jgi:hypothetical protein
MLREQVRQGSFGITEPSQIKKNYMIASIFTRTNRYGQTRVEYVNGVCGSKNVREKYTISSKIVWLVDTSILYSSQLKYC